jgi:AmpD protein
MLAASHACRPPHGLLIGVKQVLSPFFDARPPGVRPISSCCTGSACRRGIRRPWISRLFTGNLPAERTASSANARPAGLGALLVRRDGEWCSTCRSRRARGTPASRAGRAATPATTSSIGIECEGTDETPYEAAQYAALRGLLPLLLGAYPAITRERIVGHSDVAPGRKTDPGPSFDWNQVR